MVWQESLDEDIELILAGDVDGIFNLANDLRGRADPEVVIWLYRLAFDRGVQESALNLAGFLEEVGKPTKAKKWYKIAYRQGDDRAAVMRALLSETEGNLESSLKWFRRGETFAPGAIHHARVARELGNQDEAKLVLARHMAASAEATVDYLEMFGSEFDDEGLSLLEEFWLQKEVVVGVPLANAYAKLGRLQDEEMTLRKAVSLGDGFAAFNLAINFANSNNYSEALVWMQKAAQMGDDSAANWIADYEAEETSI